MKAVSNFQDFFCDDLWVSYCSTTGESGENLRTSQEFTCGSRFSASQCSFGEPLPHVNPLVAFEGKYPEAELLYERATDFWEKALGPEHPTVATVLNNRALMWKTLGRAVGIFQESDVWMLRC